MSLQRLAIVGAGGFARELLWLVDEINRVRPTYAFAGFVVSDLGKLTDYDSRDRIVGDLAWLERGEVDALALGIGTPAPRLKVAAELEARFPALAWPVLQHPNVVIDTASAKLGKGSILCAGTIGTVNVTIEPFALINLACTIGHEAVIGRGSVLNPGVNVSGGVVIEDGVLVGTGAKILQYVRIGRGAILGAGGVALRDLPAGATAVGIPAKPLQRENR